MSRDRFSEPLRVFVGYDSGERVAWHVAVSSLIRHASQPLQITPLCLDNLAPVYRETHGDGSTEFAYSRWLTPYLAGYTGLALFVDGDVLFRDDVAKLFDESSNHLGAAVWCVKHPDYVPRAEKKFRDAPQSAYPRKNWSSVMLFRCNSSICQKLTPEFIEKATGAQLHQFEWCPDDRIGELSPRWNHLVGEKPPSDEAELLHFTEGVPAFRAYADCDSSGEWFDELHRLTSVEEI
jgi:hypothetical protein